MTEHELAVHVLDIVDQAACRAGAARVLEVQLALGGLRVFDVEELRAQFAQAARGSVAEGARLEISINAVTHHCRACGHDFPGGAGETPCARCGHFHTEPVSGHEIRLLGIAVEGTAPRRPARGPSPTRASSSAEERSSANIQSTVNLRRPPSWPR
jgi:hydrogenase nickel incorporation protein HypA/HybF